MCDKHAIANPLYNFIHGIFETLRMFYHVIGDICLGCNITGNRNRWFDEHLNSVCDSLVFHLDCTEFNDVIVITGKACCFKVITDVFHIINLLICCVAYNQKTVIDHIHFAAESNFEVSFRIFLCTAFTFPICFGKSLYIRMICNDNTSVSKIKDIVYNLTYIAHTIHFTHQCMTVPFNSLSFRIVRDLWFFQHFNLLYRHDKISFKVIIFNTAINTNTISRLVFMHHFSGGTSALKAFDLDRICTIIDGHGLYQHTLSGFNLFHRKDFTFNLNITDRLIYI